MTVELSDLSKRVGADTHIHPTSVSLAENGFNVLLGETGAGKTTLIKLIAGLERPTTGEIRIKGRDVTRLSTQRRNISLVHQFFVNYPTMSVFDNIASPLRVARMSRAEIVRRVGEAAELMRLTPMLKRRPSELSGGQQQRTALARAIVKNSDVVLLDEPLANLDYKLREELRDELPRLFAGRGATVIYATSEPHEALLLGGHTAAMREGRITQFGPTAEVFRQPRDLETARVFSDPPINIASIMKSGADVRMGEVQWQASDRIAHLPDGNYKVALRPHHVTPDPGTPDTVRIDGSVRITELSGSESVAHFDRAGAEWVSQAHGVHPFRVGEQHAFYFDPKHALYFDTQGKLVV